jgi:hypothetical protein
MPSDHSNRATPLLFEQVNAVPWADLGAKPTWSPAGDSARFVDIDSAKAMARLTAWDNAYCLDAEVSDVETEGVEHLCAGACDTAETFRETPRRVLSTIVERFSSEAN